MSSGDTGYNGGDIMDIEIKEKVNLGSQLRINRVRQGYTIKELAKISGVSVTTINWAESKRREKVRLDLIIKLAKSLNISLEEIIVERKIVNGIQ